MSGRPGGGGGGGGRRGGPPKQPGAPAANFLPPGIYQFFQPRPLPAFRKPIIKRKMPPYTCVSNWLSEFEQGPAPPRQMSETTHQRWAREAQEHKADVAKQLEAAKQTFNPKAETDHGQAFNTLFVGRLPYEITEGRLRREFAEFGSIKKVTLVYNQKTGQPRGYGFIEFEHEVDMQRAYKRSVDKRIEGRPIVVDVERGRTVAGWYPRRLGGGLGDSRKGEKRPRPAGIPSRPAYTSNRGPPARDGDRY